MAANALSIYFTENEIKIAEGAYIKKKIHLSKCAQAKIPEECLQDSLIFHKENMREFLGGILTSNGMNAKKCHIVVDGNLIMAKNLVIPAVAESKLRKIIVADMVQVIGVPQNYIIDYEIKEVIKEGKSKSYNIMAAAIQKNKVKSCTDLLKSLKLKPETMNISNSTIEELALAEIGRDSTYIIADRFNENMTATILSNGKHMMSRSVGLNLSLVSIFNSSDGLANEVVSELSRIIGFYSSSQYGVRPKITNVYLTGDFAGDDNILEDISGALGVDTSFMGGDISADEKRMFTEYACAAGAFLK